MPQTHGTEILSIHPSQLVGTFVTDLLHHCKEHKYFDRQTDCRCYTTSTPRLSDENWPGPNAKAPAVELQCSAKPVAHVYSHLPIPHGYKPLTNMGFVISQCPLPRAGHDPGITSHTHKRVEKAVCTGFRDQWQRKQVMNCHS